MASSAPTTEEFDEDIPELVLPEYLLARLVDIPSPSMIPDHPVEHLFQLYTSLRHKCQTQGTMITAIWESLEQSQKTALPGQSRRHHAWDREREPQVRGPNGLPHARSRTRSPRVCGAGIQFTLKSIESHIWNIDLRAVLPGSQRQFCTLHITEHPANYQEVALTYSEIADPRICLPDWMGDLVIKRQLYIFLKLQVLVNSILESRPKSPSPERDEMGKTRAVSLQDLIAGAAEQKDILSRAFQPYCAERALLADFVSRWISTKPELVKDDKGRTPPTSLDDKISSTIYEIVFGFIVAIANADYICALLELLDRESIEKVYQGIILQELSNVCHLEFNRTKRLFKRYVQSGSGRPHFHLISDANDNGTPRVSTKKASIPFVRNNPELTYMIMLCRPETDIVKAVPWVEKINSLQKSQPNKATIMEKEESEYYYDLDKIASLFESLSAIFSMPPMSSNKGQIYVSRSKALAEQIHSYSAQFDVSHLAVPLSKLEDPKVVKGALSILGKFIRDRTGTGLIDLYPNLVESCLAGV